MTPPLPQTTCRQTINAGMVFLLFIFVALGHEVTPVEAAIMEVDFEATPLFLDADVNPGDSTTRSVTITNTEVSTESVFATVTNTFDTGLASVMELVISDDTTIHFSGSFLEFFSSTPLALGMIGGGETTVYNFTASLPEITGNPYQHTQLGFDLVIGWDGGSASDATTSRSGGSSGRRETLSIFNETIAALDIVNNAVTITWNTSIPATSYLVCGDVTEAPIILQTQPPLFGYQFVLPEINAHTIDHRMVVTDLAARSYECRPASHTTPTEPYTVGAALSFSIPSGQVAGDTISVLDSPDLTELIRAVQEAYNNHAGSVLGVSTNGKGMFGGPTYDEWLMELQAEKDRRTQVEMTTSSSSKTIGGETATEAHTKLSAEEQKSLLTKHNLFWPLAIVVVILTFWYWHRKSSL